MTHPTATTSRGVSSISGAIKTLRRQLEELGLNLTVWDPLGHSYGDCPPAGEFCRLFRAADGNCARRACELAGRAMSEGQAALDAAACGGALLGVPIHRRRKLIGAAVACMPVKEMLEEESLARTCDRLQLDRPHMIRLARQVCRHSRDQAGDFLRIVQWLMERDQTAQVAQDELATLSTNLASTYEELSLLYRISGAMRVTEQPREFLENICGELLEVMSISAAAALLYPHPSLGGQDMMVVAGALPLAGAQVRRLVHEEIAPRFGKTKRAAVENDFVPAGGRDFGRAVQKLVAAPLVVEDNVIGVLVGLNKTAGDFDSVDLKLINSISNQASVFLANSRLYDDLQDLLMGVLHALTASIDAKDPYTCGHSRRVALISKRLAEIKGFAPAAIQRIYLCGLLHDIGKIGVPERTLHKEGRLTEEEYRDIKRHPDLGARILGGIRQLDDVIAGIRSHHERLDGKGYPQGLTSEQLSMEGRIVGLADCFDAMTSHRTYRQALPLAAVVQEIRGNAGTQFDPDLVQTLLSLDLPAFLQELRSQAAEVGPIHLMQEAMR